jgi:hypothetical protein
VKTYEFTLILDSVEVMTEEIANDLYEAGCSDGTPFSGEGVAAVGFGREASSLEQALMSAITDVEKAGFRVARVELDSDELALLRI